MLAAHSFSSSRARGGVDANKAASSCLEFAPRPACVSVWQRNSRP
jgi:hypothetical protein